LADPALVIDGGHVILPLEAPSGGASAASSEKNCCESREDSSAVVGHSWAPGVQPQVARWVAGTARLQAAAADGVGGTARIVSGRLVTRGDADRPH